MFSTVFPMLITPLCTAPAFPPFSPRQSVPYRGKDSHHLAPSSKEHIADGSQQVTRAN